MAKRIMKRKGLPFDALFDVKMPDTWTPLFDLSDKTRVADINRNADAQIEQVKSAVGAKVVGKHMRITTPYPTGIIGKRIYDDKTRRTSNLSVEQACIGCGLCAKKCPVHAIEMQSKRPVWVKDRCAMRLGCPNILRHSFGPFGVVVTRPSCAVTRSESLQSDDMI